MTDKLQVEFSSERDGQLAGFPERIENQMLPVITVGRGGKGVDRDSLNRRSIFRRLGSDSYVHAVMVANPRHTRAARFNTSRRPSL